MTLCGSQALCRKAHREAAEGRENVKQRDGNREEDPHAWIPSMWIPTLRPYRQLIQGEGRVYPVYPQEQVHRPDGVAHTYGNDLGRDLKRGLFQKEVELWTKDVQMCQAAEGYLINPQRPIW